jgi:hypothetical protein
VLAYDGDSARVDIAFRGSSNGQSVTGSAVYELVWADGDWKLDASKSEPARCRAARPVGLRELDGGIGHGRE